MNFGGQSGLHETESPIKVATSINEVKEENQAIPHGLEKEWWL